MKLFRLMQTIYKELRSSIVDMSALENEIEVSPRKAAAAA
jgi:hypothetical protein